MHQLNNRDGFASTTGGESDNLGPDVMEELEVLRDENSQLRSLCVELEQALTEATQAQQPIGDADVQERLRDYEAMLEEKSEMIRQLHQQLQQAQSLVADLEAKLASGPGQPTYNGPAPKEEELLALSEELERERRQLQEDEQGLMEQMREMEIGMARERAEMARQRNDVQRLAKDVQYELERLERTGATPTSIENLKGKLHDATTRRGMATMSHRKTSQGAPPPDALEAEPEAEPIPKKDSGSGLMRRLFGGGK